MNSKAGVRGFHEMTTVEGGAYIPETHVLHINPTLSVPSTERKPKSLMKTSSKASLKTNRSEEEG